VTATPIPPKVYLDTSVIVATISSGDPFNVPCQTYCAALARNDSMIYFSQLLRLEYAQFIRKLATDSKNAVPQHLFQQYQLKDFGKNMMVRHQWTKFMMTQFDVLLGTFYRVRELPIQPPILRQSNDLMSLHNIESYDAAHVATALREGVHDLATTDTKFAARVTSGLKVHLIR